MAEQDIPVAVFSMEMSRRSLFYRMICDEAQVAFQRFRRGQYNPEEAERLKVAAANVYALPIYVDERSGVSPSDYELRLKLLIAKYGVKVAFVDFLQLMVSNSKRLSGADKMNTICMDMQSAIKRTHVPAVLLSQLNREQVKAKRQPEMWDLKESSSIEQIADIAAFIWRESVTNRDKGSLKDQATLLIRKARNTERKEIAMRFTGWRMRFDELTEEEQEALG
jgi:replicative DNA helicase